NPEDLLEGCPGLTLESFNPKTVKDKVVQALKGLEFGQVVLVVKKGRLVQIERHLKERFSDLQGLGGDGI
ncbi:MAG: YezD family protein, partial [Deltaproteobacteria bacterium]|nr:YezD family protein [Deltaproteobacteria bacterium]